MRIAHFVSVYPSSNPQGVYGKSLSAACLCRALARRGIDVNVFTPHRHDRTVIDDDNGVTVRRYPARLGYGSELASSKMLLGRLEKSFDVVHLHSGISPTLLAGSKHAILNEVPSVITWHGDSIRRVQESRYTSPVQTIAAFMYRPAVNLLLERVNRIICVSRQCAMQSALLKNHINRVTVIPNGVDTSLFRGSTEREALKKQIHLEGKTVILFVGSMHRIKGPDVLLRAAANVIADYPDVHVVLVGGGDSSELVQISSSLGIRNRTTFTGHLGEERIQYYKASDIFVLPSRYECFPLVILEAMASSLPVIASDVGGIREVITDQQNGLVVPKENTEMLEAALRGLMENQGLRDVIGRNARASTEQSYSWDKIAGQVEDLYESICK